MESIPASFRSKASATAAEDGDEDNLQDEDVTTADESTLCRIIVERYGSYSTRDLELQSVSGVNPLFGGSDLIPNPLPGIAPGGHLSLNAPSPERRIDPNPVKEET